VQEYLFEATRLFRQFGLSQHCQDEVGGDAVKDGDRRGQVFQHFDEECEDEAESLSRTSPPPPPTATSALSIKTQT